MGLRNPTDPRWSTTGPDHRGPGGSDLPDHQLHLPGHGSRRCALRARGTGQHLHPDHESHPGGLRGAHRGPRRRRGGPGGGQRPGCRNGRPPQPGGERRAHRVLGIAVRGYLQPVPLHLSQARRGGHVRREPGRPRRVGGRRPTQHQGVLRGDARQSEGRRPRLRRGLRYRPWPRHPAGGGQHAGDPVPGPAAAARRRHRRPLRDQVHRRTRHLHRWCDRRRRRVRLRGERAVPRVHRARPELPRPGLRPAPRGLVPGAVRAEGPPAVPARPRTGHRPPQLVPVPPGCGDPQSAHGAPRAERHRGGLVARGA